MIDEARAVEAAGAAIVTQLLHGSFGIRVSLVLMIFVPRLGGAGDFYVVAVICG